MSYLKLISYSLLVLMVLSSCIKKPPSFGEDVHMFVIADEDNWQKLEPVVKNVFEKIIRTPQPEKVFDVAYVAPDKFSEFATRKNLVLLGILNSDGEIDSKVSNMLAPAVKAKVQTDSAFYFPKHDAWAENQLLLVLADTSVAALQKELEKNSDFLYELFHNKLRADTYTKMYERHEQVDIEQKLLEEYGWMVKVQHDYIINIERVQDRFVMLRRSLPNRERWLFVHWIEDADPSLLDEEWVAATRNKLTEKFYKGDVINSDFLESKNVDFLGRNAIMLEGLWENNEKMAGGPFRTYAFYDEPSGRLYVIDIAVYHPGGNKEPFLRQLDVMAHTFKTATEIQTEKNKEDL